MNRFAPFLLTVAAVIAVGAAARADGPVAVAVGFDNRKMTREECARKAVEAMGAKEKFPWAETTKDGNAQGWNAKVAVQVLSYPMPDPERVYIVVITAGTDGPEAERVQQIVRAHVMDGTDNPNTPARIAPAGGAAPPRPVTLTCKSQEQSATNPVLKHFAAAATIVLEKKGYQTKAGSGMVLGFFPDRSGVAFLAPTTKAISVRLNVAYATPGEEPGDKAADDLLNQIVKVLYE